MKDLIERLEKATGPDHALDCAIYREWRKSAPPPRGGGIWTTDLEYAPAYTASLDAALTLVPEGWLVNRMFQANRAKGERPWECVLWNPHLRSSTDIVESGKHETMALAVTSAALKARVHLRDAPEQEAVSPEGADGPSPERDMEGVR